MSKVKVLHYIGSLNIGGAQKLLIELLSKIDRKNVEIDVIVDKKNELYYKSVVEKYGCKIYYLKSINEVDYFNYTKQWNDFFKKHKEYKYIHCHVRSVASIVLKIAKRNGLITICHSHSTSNGKGIKSIIKKILQKDITKYSDYCFACSIDSAKWLYGKNIANSEKCFIFSNAIDSEKYIYNEKTRNKIRKLYNFENKIVIGQVGRIENMKNHLFSLEIIKALKDNGNDNVLFLIIGDGSLREEIIKKIKELNLEDNVILMGNRDDVNDLMQGMDCFLMPSKYEGLPITLIEAQASSLPCIISNNITAGFIIKELIDTVDLKSDISLWCNTIEKSLKLKRINRKKEIVASGFDMESNAKSLEEFYIKNMGE